MPHRFRTADAARWQQLFCCCFHVKTDECTTQHPEETASEQAERRANLVAIRSFLLSSQSSRLCLAWGNRDFFLLSPVTLVLMCGNQDFFFSVQSP